MVGEITIRQLSAFHLRTDRHVAVAIQAYYDGSGKSDDGSPFLTLAGFCGTPAAWEEFEAGWVEIRKSHGAPYVHMKELSFREGRKNPFRDWTAKQASALVVELWKYVSRHVWASIHATDVGNPRDFAATSATVDLKAYKRACANFSGLTAWKKPEVFCLDSVVTTALQMLRKAEGNLIAEDAQVELYFDSNERFMGPIYKAHRRYRNEGIFRQIAQIGTAVMRESPAIQAADFLAWHRNRSYTNESEGDLHSAALSLGARAYHREFDYSGIVRRFKDKHVQKGSTGG